MSWDRVVDRAVDLVNLNLYSEQSEMATAMQRRIRTSFQGRRSLSWGCGLSICRRTGQVKLQHAAHSHVPTTTSDVLPSCRYGSLGPFDRLCIFSRGIVKGVIVRRLRRSDRVVYSRTPASSPASKHISRSDIFVGCGFPSGDSNF